MTMHELQTALIKAKYDAYILTRGNMFLGQDILPEENKILELTGFSGSAGSLLVFRDKAVLFVDGRYELQASLEVDPAIASVVVTTESIGTWLSNNLEQPCTIAYDPWCHSISEVDYWNRNLKKHTFTEDNHQLLGARLSPEPVDIFEHELEFSGISMNEKISYLTSFMLKNQLDAFFVADCDAVSWLMNLRSHTLNDTPVLRAFALVDCEGEVSLFTNDFRTIEAELSSFKGKTIGVSYNHTPRKIQSLMKDHRIWLANLANPIQGWKAIKNPVELNGIKQAHLRDGVAMVKFLHWLNNNWDGQDELSIVSKLHSFRAEGQYFYGNSFETIAAFAEHGAIVHYQPTPKSNHKLTQGSVLLLDSGAQYYDGTTDITRTIAIGEPTAEVIASFTQVLQAHIAAASAYFPEGCSGTAIDSLARAALWKHGKDYKHGTGHGVGCFLNVHEGPQRLAATSAQYPLAANMITSIEPGYYQAGAYGIRIENLTYITSVNTGTTLPMLKFMPLTLVPIDKHLINKYLLNQSEIDWVNTYHTEVANQLSPLLDENDRQWLSLACAPL